MERSRHAWGIGSRGPRHVFNRSVTPMLRRLCLGLSLAVSLGLAVDAQSPANLQEVQEVQGGAGLVSQQKCAEAIEALEAVVTDDPEFGTAWFQFGLARHFAGDLDEAIRADLLSLQIGNPLAPYRVTATYNIAYVYALQGKNERSFRWLSRARNAGFADFATVAKDTDIKGLHGDARFQAFVVSGTLAAPLKESAGVATITEIMPGRTGGIERAPDGTLYVANFGADVWTVSPEGVRTEVPIKNLVEPVDPDTGAMKFLCELPGGGNGHSVWLGDALYVTARKGHRVCRVSLDGQIALVAGTGMSGATDGDAVTATFRVPNGIAITPDDETLFVNSHLSGNRSVVPRIDLR